MGLLVNRGSLLGVLVCEHASVQDKGILAQWECDEFADSFTKDMG